MNKSDIAAHIARRASVPKPLAQSALDAVVEALADALAQGGDRHPGRVRHVLDQDASCAPRTQPAHRRTRRHRRLHRAHVQARQDASRRRQPEPGIEAHALSTQTRASVEEFSRGSPAEAGPETWL